MDASKNTLPPPTNGQGSVGELPHRYLPLKHCRSEYSIQLVDHGIPQRRGENKSAAPDFVIQDGEHQTCQSSILGTRRNPDGFYDRTWRWNFANRRSPWAVSTLGWTSKLDQSGTPISPSIPIHSRGNLAYLPTDDQRFLMPMTFCETLALIASALGNQPMPLRTGTRKKEAIPNDGGPFTKTIRRYRRSPHPPAQQVRCCLSPLTSTFSSCNKAAPAEIEGRKRIQWKGLLIERSFGTSGPWRSAFGYLNFLAQGTFAKHDPNLSSFSDNATN